MSRLERSIRREAYAEYVPSFFEHCMTAVNNYVEAGMLWSTGETNNHTHVYYPGAAKTDMAHTHFHPIDTDGNIGPSTVDGHTHEKGGPV